MFVTGKSYSTEVMKSVPSTKYHLIPIIGNYQINLSNIFTFDMYVNTVAGFVANTCIEFTSSFLLWDPCLLSITLTNGIHLNPAHIFAVRLIFIPLTISLHHLLTCTSHTDSSCTISIRQAMEGVAFISGYFRVVG